MYANWTISAFLNALACLALALALVMSPPSASHAGSGMHSDHHASGCQNDHKNGGHEHGSMSSVAAHDGCGSISKAENGDDSSGQCCSGICLSVVLDNTVGIFVEQATSGKYLTLHAQTNSIEPSGFLRPPQLLI